MLIALLLTEDHTQNLLTVTFPGHSERREYVGLEENAAYIPILHLVDLAWERISSWSGAVFECGF
jgi:hypothetical protein